MPKITNRKKVQHSATTEKSVQGFCRRQEGCLYKCPHSERGEWETWCPWTGEKIHIPKRDYYKHSTPLGWNQNQWNYIPPHVGKDPEVVDLMYKLRNKK